jgi:hypothetical protein
MRYVLKDSIRWLDKWDPISQKHYKVLQVLTIVSHLDDYTGQGTVEEIWVDVPTVEEKE